jgi:hypothetical protein
MKGTILYTSWGYGMTTVDFAVVIGETDKTVLCRRCKAKVEGQEGFTTPLPNELVGEPFRLYKRDGYYYKGSYPYILDRTSKRLGLFWKWGGEPMFYSTID